MVRSKHLPVKAKRLKTAYSALEEKKSSKKLHEAIRKRAKKLAADRKQGVGPDLWIAVADPSKADTRTLRFGRVVVANTIPDPVVLSSNVDAGRQALKRATEVLVTPGVRLRLAAGVPRFRADPRERGLLVRELNGATQRGRIIDGAFVPVD